MEVPEDKPQKRKIVSGFDKIALVLVILIITYIISVKSGCDVVEKEEKVEWID